MSGRKPLKSGICRVNTAPPGNHARADSPRMTVPAMVGNAPRIRRSDLSYRAVAPRRLLEMRALVERDHAGRLSFGRAGAVISSSHWLRLGLLVIAAASAGIANAQTPNNTTPADAAAAIRATVKLEP